MKPYEEQLLREVLMKQGGDRVFGPRLARKVADLNPLDNSMWSNLIDGALKGLEVVALATFDWKLTAIVKLLQSWIKDKREEKRKKQEEEAKYDPFSQYDTPYSSTYY